MNPTSHQNLCWPWKLIWKVKVLRNVSYFVCLVGRKTCLTRDKLQRKGLQIWSRCLLCIREGKSDERLFLCFKTTINLRHMFFSILRIKWVMPKSTLELLSNWKNVGRSSTKENWWQVIPACIWWTVWKESNLRHFEDSNNSIWKIRSNCLSLVFCWCKQNMWAEIWELVDLIVNV